ncbi:MAG: hypothetical protein P8J91_09595 [Pirellulaceae bacterium]|nr:hypothetical protein [Planctomycetaceae bacterium]MDG1807927.1 hypothetical protein [Pirellulaceae bacterium]MDG2103992.1 hypothetical protein [Pirellulaceae bacterium]
MKRRVIQMRIVGIDRRAGGLRPHWFCLLCLLGVLLGSTSESLAQFDLTFPQPSAELTVHGHAEQIRRWRQGSWDVFHLVGNARLSQGNITLGAEEAIVWVDTEPGEQAASILVYLEKSAQLEIKQESGKLDRFEDEQWFGRLRTRSGMQFNNLVQEISADNAPAIFQRGNERRQQEIETIRQAQYVISPITGEVQEVLPETPAIPQPANQFPNQLGGPISPAPANGAATLPPPVSNSNMNTQVSIVPKNTSRGSNLNRRRGNRPGEYIYINTGGTQITIDSTELGRLDQMGQPRTSRLVIQADNIVAWESPMVKMDGSATSRWEIYMEGNIVFAQGNRVVFAERMYYDVLSRRGTILKADVLTPVPSYKGLVRLKADVVQQLDENNLQAFGAAITSSRLGVPRYWLQSDQLNISRTPRQSVDPFSGLPVVNPQTGEQVGDDYFIESRANKVYLGGVPVFYWPRLRTDLKNPNYFISRFRVGNDNIFGFQLGVGLDLFQLLGIRNQPENARWVSNIDYLSERGLGGGTDADYRGPSLFGTAGLTDSYFRSWFINDQGFDNLGLDRRMVPLEQEFRGRLLWRHHKQYSRGHNLRAEIGWLSDRNFLQQYFEKEWDQDKNYSTGIWLEKNINSHSFNLVADYGVNDFFTHTDWLPRFDHYVIGQPVMFDRAVWHGKTTISYGSFRTAVPPTNSVDAPNYDPLAWEGFNREGIVTGTRQEIDFPIDIGPSRVVPYLLGGASYYQQDLAGDEFVQFLGQIGVRTSLPLWRVDPTVHSTLLNLNGLAHKINWTSEYLYADASANFDRLPLYNQLDDDAQEFFRRRFAVDTFGVTPGLGENIALKYDERYFALRSNTQGNVTTPAMEIADDLLMIRTGFRNRWQTKRGLPGEARVVDWVTLDVNYNFYPKKDRDNFGARYGMFDYDFRWNIGDRLSVVSDGFFDFFSQGLRTASLGTKMSRPGVGDLYVGFRTIEGPISSNVLLMSGTYRMSEKWILRGASAIDFAETGNIGQTLNVTRVGESFLLSMGVQSDTSQDNLGFLFAIEPRFFPSGKLGLVGGQRILPASTENLD